MSTTAANSEASSLNATNSAAVSRANQIVKAVKQKIPDYFANVKIKNPEKFFKYRKL